MKERRHHKNFRQLNGVTLLEMIIVLAIIGMTMIVFANYQRKEARKSSQQTLANNIVRDISGVMEFISQEHLEVLVNGKPGTPITNPLYNTSSNLFYHARVVGKTLQDEPISANAGNSYSGWSISQPQVVNISNGSRYLFLGKECGANSKAFVNAELSASSLSCQLANGAESRELVLERVDFVNNLSNTLNLPDAEAKLRIERVDFYLAHHKAQDDEGLHFVGFVQYLEKALNNAGLNYLNATVVQWNGTNSAEFTLVKVDGSPLLLSDVANQVAKLDGTKNYAIRLSLDKSSEAVLADGSTPVNKLCWNSAKGETGPCISAIDNDRLLITEGGGSDKQEPGMCWDKGSNTSVLCLAAMNSDGVNSMGDNPDDRILHLRTTAQNAAGIEATPGAPGSMKGTTGTLYANVVMENTSRRHPVKWHIAYTALDALDLKDAKQDNDNTLYDFEDAFKDQYELVTPPVVFYQSFKNDYPQGEAPIGASQQYIDGNNERNYDSLLTEPGVIRLPLQTCPKVAGLDSTGSPVMDSDKKPLYRKLYPRLTVSLSSIAADGRTDQAAGYMDYTQQGATRSNTENVPLVGAVAGISLQANIVVAKKIADNISNNPDKKGSTFDGWLSDIWFSGTNKESPFWLISATAGTIDLEGGGINKINPESLSVVITQWCSTIPQGGIISSEATKWKNSYPHIFLLHSIVAEDTNLKFYDDNGTEVDYPDHERMMY